MRVLYSYGRAAMLSLALSTITASCGPSPHDPMAVASLNEAIVKQDVKTTQSLLKKGIDPQSKSAAGQMPLDSALELLIVGTERVASLSPPKWDSTDPRLLIVRDVMRAVRRTSHVPFNELGKIDISMASGGWDPDRGNIFVQHLMLVTKANERRELLLAEWETEYVDIEVDDGGSPILRPGAIYKVVGVATGESIEVERLQMSTPAKGTASLAAVVHSYLPSTQKQIVAFNRRRLHMD